MARRGLNVLSSTVATLHNNSAHGEDNYLVRALGEHAVLDAVMDGVSRRGGGQASRRLADGLAAAPLTSVDDVVAVLEEVNRQLYQTGGGQFLLTTVAAALSVQGKLSIVSAGDSSILLIRSESPQQLCRGARGGFIGARKQLVDLYRAEVTIEPGDRVVLATDGVTDNVTGCELVEVMRRAVSPDEAAGQLHSILTTRQAEGRLPTPLGGRFRDDDWTTIIRFFSVTSARASTIDLPH
jgi:serine/threonine protein phosphatase PrpC